MIEMMSKQRAELKNEQTIEMMIKQTIEIKRDIEETSTTQR